MGRSAPSYLLIRNGNLCIRFRVPLDLARRLGRVEVVRALGTTDRRVGRIVAARIGLRLHRLWATMRVGSDLTEAELRRLADAWLRREVEREWALLDSGDFARNVLPDDTDIAEARRANADLFAQDAWLTEQALLETLPAARHAVMDAAAEELLDAAGHGKRRGSRERAMLSVMLLERRIDLQQSKMAWAEGDPAHLPPQLAEQPGAPPQTAGTASHRGPAPAGALSPSRSLGEAIDVFIAHARQHGAKEKTIKDLQVKFRLLKEALGPDRPMRSITAEQAGRLWETLRALPASFRSAPVLVGLDPFAAAARAREQAMSPMHFRTANAYLATWRKLLDQEVAAGQATVNPFSGKRVVAAGRVETQDRTFSAGELEAIFANPLFQGAKDCHARYSPGARLVDDWMFWAPLIALMSGCRIGEIAQLRPNDIRQAHGHTVLDINEEGGKRLKNKGTARQIPVHPRLVELGLLRLADERQAAGHVLLLPELPRPVNGDPGSPLSKWMCERFLPRLGLKTRPGLGWHSFRHTLKTLLRNADVADTVNNHICGHDERTAGVGARYGRIDLEAMAKALGRVTLPSAVNTIRPRL